MIRSMNHNVLPWLRTAIHVYHTGLDVEMEVTQCTHVHTCMYTCCYIPVYDSVWLCAHRFVQKQGLDRTFVECDNHMWRVDNRKLPGDITVDGGSDWIAIHRNYSRYLVTDRSRFLTGLKRYYEFSLLPAEVHVHCTL